MQVINQYITHRAAKTPWHMGTSESEFFSGVQVEEAAKSEEKYEWM